MPGSAQHSDNDVEKRQRDTGAKQTEKQVTGPRNRGQGKRSHKPDLGWDYHYLITPFVI